MGQGLSEHLAPRGTRLARGTPTKPQDDISDELEARADVRGLIRVDAELTEEVGSGLPPP
jgi:hypothetical protein